MNRSTSAPSSTKSTPPEAAPPASIAVPVEQRASTGIENSAPHANQPPNTRGGTEARTSTHDEGFSGFLAFLGEHSGDEEDQSWECPSCTYLNNNPPHFACEVCGSFRKAEQPRDGQAFQDDLTPEMIDDIEASMPIAQQIAATHEEDASKIAKKERGLFSPGTGISVPADCSTSTNQEHRLNIFTARENSQDSPSGGQAQLEMDTEMATEPSPRAPEPRALTTIDFFASATLVSEQEPEDPVYDAIAVRRETCSSWCTRNRKYIFVGLASLFIGAMAATVATVLQVGSQGTKKELESQEMPSPTPNTTKEVETQELQNSTHVYYADWENKICLNDTSGLDTSALPQRMFETVEECCEAEFLHLKDNECTANSYALSSMDRWSNHSGIWNQQGQIIIGEAAGDWLGRSLALSSDGATIAIGASGKWADSDRPGYVKVFHRENNDSRWELLGRRIDGDAVGDIFGRSVALSVNALTLAVGAPGSLENSDRQGYVRVYYREDDNSSSWKQLGQDIKGEANGDKFGYSVSLSDDGNTLAIGANLKDANGIDDSGHVRVFQLESVGAGHSWKQLGQDIDGEAAHDNAGYSVALSGDGKILAVGSHMSDNNGEDAGHVRVFQIKSDSEGDYWQRLGQSINGHTTGDRAGRSVSLSRDGRTIAIGAPGSEENSNKLGHVRVYIIEDSFFLSWKQLGQDITGDELGDHLGWSVSLSSNGRTLATGADHNDGGGTDSGLVRVYHFEDVDLTWKQIGEDIYGEKAGDHAGLRVSLSDDGNIVAIGSHWNDDNGDESGHVRVFATATNSTLSSAEVSLPTMPMPVPGNPVSAPSVPTSPSSGNGEFPTDLAVYSNSSLAKSIWQQRGQTIGDAAGDSFGKSVALSNDGTTLVIGAPGKVGNTDRPGYVVAFWRESNDSNWKLLGRRIKGDADGDEFGSSVDISADGRTLAVGATGYWKVEDRPGYVKVYQRGSDSISTSWQLLGPIIHGEAKGDQFGISVSLCNDGKTLAIGANTNDGHGRYSGHVRVYSLEVNGNNSSWKQLGQDIEGEAAYDNAGRSVSLSGGCEVLAIGSINGEDAGLVRVYELNGESDNWQQLGWSIRGERALDKAGSSVCLSSDGKTLALGFPGKSGNTDRPGYVRVYYLRRDIFSLKWRQLGQDIMGDDQGDLLGRSVSISSDGRTLAAGGDRNDGNGISSGLVRMYHFEEIDSNWKQIGEDIYGENSYDNAGYSVDISSDGRTVVIGAVGNNDNGPDSGQVRVFSTEMLAASMASPSVSITPSSVNEEPLTGDAQSGWKKLGETFGDSAGDSFGMALALSSDDTTLAIGAPGENGDSDRPGYVRVFWRDVNGSNWRQSYQINGAADGDEFGSSMAISSDGRVVAVGAPGHWKAEDRPGYVKVHQRESDSISPDWQMLGSIIYGEANGVQFGISVSLSDDGNTLAIGANGYDGNGDSSGHVRIYTLELDGLSSNWKQLGQDIEGEAAYDNAGYSVSLSGGGEILAIGSINGEDAGLVRVYEFNGERDNWQQLGQRIRGETAGDKAGRSVSLSLDGKTLAVGLPGKTGNTDRPGYVRVYYLRSDVFSLKWRQLGQDIMGDEHGDEFGWSVSISSDGRTLAVGGDRNDGNGISSGIVRMYHFEQIDSYWKQIGEDIYGESSYDNAGYSVALSSDGLTVLIGAIGNDDNGPDSGQVRAFSTEKLVAPTITATPSSVNEESLTGDAQSGWKELGETFGDAPGDLFGVSLALSSDDTTLAIGAPGSFGNSDRPGYVKVFWRDGNESNWKNLGRINGAAAGDLFGSSVALSENGHTLAVGAAGSWKNNDRPGYVRVYIRDVGAASSWQQLGQDIKGEANGDQFGVSVSLSDDGKTLAIGANAYDGNGDSSGQVRIYTLELLSSSWKQLAYWKQLGKDIDDEANSSAGYSVSLSADGRAVAIGAHTWNGNSGHVRVYQLEAGDAGMNWKKLGADIAGGKAGDRSGYSVSLSAGGHTVAIGAPGDGDGSRPGHVRVYQLEDGVWKWLGQSIVGEANGDEFGISVSLSLDKKTLAIGGDGNDSNGSSSGHVRVYRLDEPNSSSSWKQIGQDIEGKNAADYFGFSVALSSDGQTVVIGANGNDVNGPNSGHVRLFRIDH